MWQHRYRTSLRCNVQWDIYKGTLFIISFLCLLIHCFLMLFEKRETAKIRIIKTCQVWIEEHKKYYLMFIVCICFIWQNDIAWSMWLNLTSVRLWYIHSNHIRFVRKLFQWWQKLITLQSTMLIQIIKFLSIGSSSFLH